MIKLGRSLITSMNGKDYPVQRNASGSYSMGVWVPQYSTPTAVSVRATVQPLSGNEIVRIPEGDSGRERLKLYSADPLYISDETTGRDADVLTIDGVQYQVESVEKWTQYYKAILVRKDPPEAGA